MTAPATNAPGAVRRLRLRSILESYWFNGVAAGVLAVLVGSVILDDPRRVDLEITNPTVYAVSIQVGDVDRDRWLRVATLSPDSTRTIKDVIDQGETWVVRFEGQARDGGELEVTRDDLEAADWHLDIPTAVGDRLEAQGATPSPPTR